MRPRTTSPPVQLALDLKRETTALPIAREPTALLQAIADLLLGALGERVADATSTVRDEGGTDESEDNA